VSVTARSPGGTQSESNRKKPLIYLGSGAYAYTMYEAIELAGPTDHVLAGFAQNVDPERRGETFEGYPVYWVEDLKPLAGTHEVVCPLADGAAKRAFVRQVEPYGFRFATVCSAMTRVSRRTEIGPGLHLSWGSVICSHSRIGSHCTVMVQVLISEGVTIGDYVFLGAGAKVGGGVEIGHGVFVGMNASIRDHVRVGVGATIGVGSVVVKDVPDGVTVLGNPAREFRRTGGLFKSGR